jgi:hypothetical protein
MVLTGWKTALSEVSPEDCHLVVCDLAHTTDLSNLLNASGDAEAARLVTFFGMIPNFEPAEILSSLSSTIRATDLLLFSANLSPGPDYLMGTRRILPLYDNIETREWLFTVLSDLGVERDDGEMAFDIEEVGGLLRVIARYRFRRPRVLSIEKQNFTFAAGETIQLFFSYRYTPDRIRGLLASHGLQLVGEWFVSSGEEGVFLFTRG